MSPSPLEGEGLPPGVRSHDVAKRDEWREG